MNQTENDWQPEDGPKELLSNQIKELLSCKLEMLDDYFSIQINRKHQLVGIPLLLGNENEF